MPSEPVARSAQQAQHEGGRPRETDGQWSTMPETADVSPSRNVRLQADELCHSVLQHRAVNGPSEEESPIGDDVTRKHIQVSLQAAQEGSLLC